LGIVVSVKSGNVRRAKISEKRVKQTKRRNANRGKKNRLRRGSENSGKEMPDGQN